VAGFGSALWRDILGDICSRMQLCFSFSTSFLPLEESKFGIQSAASCVSFGGFMNPQGLMMCWLLQVRSMDRWPVQGKCVARHRR